MNRRARKGGSNHSQHALSGLASTQQSSDITGEIMPLLYVDLIEGRTPADIRTLLDAIHDAVVEAFGVPPRDRYQVVRTHPSHEIVVWDTGLGIERSAALVVVHVVSRRRSPEMKQRFYELVAANLAARCGLDSSDLVVSITDNSDEDWSFGYGRAQFLTGELT
jgi:phenylpyruvate tautomerase PptA (4-oxalocrotonate tautomerase family)